MKRWEKQFDDFTSSAFDWLALDEAPRFEVVSSSFKKLCSSNPDELDVLFDELVQIHSIYEKLNNDEFSTLSVEQKWAKVFKNKNIVQLKKLVAILLSIFPSNAFCESVFSHVNRVWTSEKNSFLIETVNSIVSIKCNADFDCSEAFDLFCSDSELLNQAKCNQKY